MAAANVLSMRCPVCAAFDDKVVDSRLSDDGRVTRRRRQCLACEHRFTTFERLDSQPVMVVKRNGEMVPFDTAKVAAGIHAAAKGRPIDDAEIDDLVEALEERAMSCPAGITTEQLGLGVLEWLAERDPVAYLRFASVYKGFDDPDDFQREARLLKTGSVDQADADK
jgi:transcriptional repressor NrdR